MQILAPELNDRLLADFLDMESSLIVSMHIQSVDQVKAIKDGKAEDYRPGPQQDRGTEESIPWRL